MARPRKDAPPSPPTQVVHLRIPLTLVTELGAMADKKKQSRNHVIVTLLAKALRRKTKEVQG
jgi:metal-responsive CopG/Arc/MetJ family transcriptional regulator